MHSPGTDTDETGILREQFQTPIETDRSFLTTARLVGVLFILGTVAGIASGVFVEPFLTPDANATQYLSRLSAGGMQMMLGAALVFVMGISLALIPVLMYPILRRYSEPFAIGYLIFRGALEFVLYLALMGILLTILALSNGTVAGGTATTGAYNAVIALLTGYEVVYFVLLTIVFAVGAFLLYVPLYRTELIPRWLAAWGLLAAILWLAWGVSGLFGLVDPASTLQVGVALPIESAFALPIALQEIVLAIWLIVRGFDRSALDALRDGHIGG